MNLFHENRAAKRRMKSLFFWSHCKKVVKIQLRQILTKKQFAKVIRVVRKILRFRSFCDNQVIRKIEENDEKTRDHYENAQ